MKNSLLVQIQFDPGVEIDNQSMNEVISSQFWNIAARNQKLSTLVSNNLLVVSYLSPLPLLPGDWRQTLTLSHAIYFRQTYDMNCFVYM